MHHRSSSRDQRLLPLLLLAGGLAAAPAAATTPEFAAPFLSFDTGATPSAVATGDFNGDGKPDLATADYGSSTVSVLLGNGDASFGPKSGFPTGPNPTSIAVADLNADGRLDLVTSNSGYSTVSLLLGNGDGTFARSDVPIGNAPVSVALGDLDADGNADIVTANETSSTVSILPGIGDGTFGTHTDYGNLTDNPAVAIGDLNGDGKPDVVAVSRANTRLTVLLGNGNGTFVISQFYTTAPGPGTLVIADLDGDGIPDLALACDNAISVMLGHGDGSFGARIDRPVTAVASIAIGDVNADGKPDLVATSNRPLGTYEEMGMVSVLLGNGDGTFGSATDYVAGSRPGAVLVADLNGDAKPDIAEVNPGGDTIGILIGTGNGGFGTNPSYATGVVPLCIAVGDLNEDGKLDLVTANYGTYPDAAGSLSVLLGNGDGSVGVESELDVNSQAYYTFVAIGDLNQDGVPDLVANGGPGVSVILGHGDGTFGPRTDLDAGGIFSTVAIGDLDGDGHPDLAVANPYANKVSVLLGHGDGSFGTRTDVATPKRPSCVAIGDLNGDGKPDLVTANSNEYPEYTGSVSVLLGNGDGTFGPQSDYADGARSVAIGDLNGDGKPDLVIAGNHASSKLAVLLGNGDGTFAAATDYDMHPGAVSLADVNGDGHLDAIAVISNAVSVLLGNGDGSLGSRFDYGAGAGAYAVAVGDLNRDGKLDLATANASSRSVTVLLNIGTTLSVEPGAIPGRFELESPFPNPFRSRTTFDFAVPAAARVRLEIFDVQGRYIESLQDGVLAPGRYSRSWSGATAGTGVYFARFSAPGVQLTKKMLLVR